MIDAGLLEGECNFIPEMPDGGSLHIERITWAGHDFLDSTRDNAVWATTKSRLKAAGSWTFGLVLDIAKDEIKKRVGLLTGGD